MRKVYAQIEYCMNCRLCEVSCIVAHSKSKDLFKAFHRENLRNTARVRVEEKRPLSAAIQCRHCDQPACVQSCISGAMTKDAVTGVVHCQEEKCVGCWTCVVACPYGAVRPGRRDGKSAPLKCDLCQGLSVPACVQTCPNQALVYEERGREI